MTIPANKSSIARLDVFEQNYRKFCEQSSLIYPTEGGWVATIQPLRFIFSIKTKVLPSREDVWSSVYNFLPPVFLATLCESNSDLIATRSKETIVSSSENLTKKHGHLTGLKFRQCASKFLLPDENELFIFEEKDLYFDYVCKKLDTEPYILFAGSLEYQVIRTTCSDHELVFADAIP